MHIVLAGGRAPAHTSATTNESTLVRVDDQWAVEQGCLVRSLMLSGDAWRAFQQLVESERRLPAKLPLHGWCPCVTPGGRLVFVGTKPGIARAAHVQLQCSAPVCARVGQREVECDDGRRVVLVGPISGRLCQRSQVPLFVCTLFADGVPANWHALLHEWKSMGVSGVLQQRQQERQVAVKKGVDAESCREVSTVGSTTPLTGLALTNGPANTPADSTSAGVGIAAKKGKRPVEVAMTPVNTSMVGGAVSRQKGRSKRARDATAGTPRRGRKPASKQASRCGEQPASTLSRGSASKSQHSGVCLEKRSGVGSEKRSRVGSEKRSGISLEKRSGVGSEKRSGIGLDKRSGVVAGDCTQLKMCSVVLQRVDSAQLQRLMKPATSRAQISKRKLTGQEKVADASVVKKKRTPARKTARHGSTLASSQVLLTPLNLNSSLVRRQCRVRSSLLLHGSTAASSTGDAVERSAADAQPHSKSATTKPPGRRAAQQQQRPADKKPKKQQRVGQANVLADVSNVTGKAAGLGGSKATSASHGKQDRRTGANVADKPANPRTQRAQVAQLRRLQAQNTASDDIFAASGNMFAVSGGGGGGIWPTNYGCLLDDSTRTPRRRELERAPVTPLSQLFGGDSSALPDGFAAKRGGGGRGPAGFLARTPTYQALVSPTDPLNRVDQEAGVRYVASRNQAMKAGGGSRKRSANVAGAPTITPHAVRSKGRFHSLAGEIGRLTNTASTTAGRRRQLSELDDEEEDEYEDGGQMSDCSYC